MGLSRTQGRWIQVHYSAEGTRAGPAAELGVSISKMGTVCVSSASTGLCGGRRVTAVPTATAQPSFSRR